MKVSALAAAAAVGTALLLGGCVDEYAYGPPVGYASVDYVGYYDGYYGPYDYGFWAPSGYFYYSDRNGRFHRDVGGHFSHTAGQGLHAISAMPKGGKLTIKTANTSFKDAVSFSGVAVPPGEYVTLSVSDTGTGMDEETRNRLFEPFFTTKAAGKGTGLGLATVYGVVKQSGGYIFADSELGKGTTFRIYLPRVDLPLRTPSSQAAQGLPPDLPPGSETFLVVEDEPAFRDLLCEQLRSRGYQVLVASNGVEALQVAEQHKGPIRVLITDVIMPEMSGPDLAKNLTKLRGETDVLYMSGYTDDKLSNILETEPELTLIQKPFSIDDLVQKIQEILCRKGRHSHRGDPSLDLDLRNAPDL